VTESDFPSAAELVPVSTLCGGNVEYRREGQSNFVYMQKLRFRARGTAHEMDALLCLNHNNASYPTKLYLAENVGCNLNWNETPVLFGKQWHTYSWSGVSPGASVMEILAMHLRAMEPELAA
jgi:hypothetical protein